MAAKILLVEDEYLSRNNMCKYLKGEGYEMREVTNGAEALEVLVSERFDLVITDFVMPHVDGFRLVELMHAKWPDIPVILITGYLSARAGKTILGDRAAEVITKPIDLAELLKAVQRIL